jgi:hypothetical protein
MAPTPPSVVALEVHVDYPVHYFVPSRTVNLLAYTVASDGSYRDVTDEVTWVSTQPEVISIRQGAVTTGTALTPGAASIHASYQGLSDQLTLTVRPWQDFQESSLRLQLPANLHPGHTGRAVAYLNDLDEEVTSRASWTSSNPQILTVDGGRLTALRPGTVRVMASYNGYTEDCVLSVHPSHNQHNGEAAIER